MGGARILPPFAHSQSTALFSVNCSSGGKTLQVFCLDPGQDFMKLPPIDPVHEAYGRVYALLT